MAQAAIFACLMPTLYRLYGPFVYSKRSILKNDFAIDAAVFWSLFSRIERKYRFLLVQAMNGGTVRRRKGRPQLFGGKVFFVILDLPEARKA